VGGGSWPPAELIGSAMEALRSPGLVVIAGAPGTGRSTVLRRLGESFRGTVFAGGALAMLRGVPALPLSRAVRVRLPAHDAPLLAEAVRSRVRHRLPGDAESTLRAASTVWLNVPAMPPDAAAALVRQIAPGAPTGVVADVVR